MINIDIVKNVFSMCIKEVIYFFFFFVIDMISLYFVICNIVFYFYIINVIILNIFVFFFEWN